MYIHMCRLRTYQNTNTNKIKNKDKKRNGKDTKEHWKDGRNQNFKNSKDPRSRDLAPQLPFQPPPHPEFRSQPVIFILWVGSPKFDLIGTTQHFRYLYLHEWNKTFSSCIATPPLPDPLCIYDV